MRILFALIVALAPFAAQAQFKRYFDVSALRIAAFAEPDWAVRVEENRVRYLCTNEQRCPMPTGVDIKGIVRGEKLPEGFESGELSPVFLKKQGDATAARLGSTFIKAEPLEVAGRKGVHMEASADVGGTIYFVTRWIGQGDRLLEVKVTARDLAQARSLAETASQSLVPQLFAN